MQLFTDIETLYTFSGAAAKSGRKIASSDLHPIRNAVVLEDNGQVLWVGPKSDFNKKRKEILKNKKFKIVSLKAKTVFPAFIDCHTHLIFAGNRKNEFEMRNQGATYQEIAAEGGGILSTVRATRAAKDSELLSLAQERAQKLLDQGVTTVEVKSGYGLNHETELRLLNVAKKIKNIRVIKTYLGPHSLPPENRSPENYINEIIEKTLPEIQKKKLAERVDVFVENGFYSLELAEKYAVAAQKMGFELTAHAEQLSRTGASALYARLRAASVDHLVCINKKDIQNLSKSETTCVLLPSSDFYLKINYPPARELIDAGACVALSTDFNPGTSPTLDLSFIGVLARLEMKMSLAEVFSALTVGAAHALGLQYKLGSLEPGKFCDFIVTNAELSDFFYQIGSHPVLQTIKNGKKIKKS